MTKRKNNKILYKFTSLLIILGFIVLLKEFITGEIPINPSLLHPLVFAIWSAKHHESIPIIESDFYTFRYPAYIYITKIFVLLTNISKLKECYIVLSIALLPIFIIVVISTANTLYNITYRSRVYSQESLFNYSIGLLGLFWIYYIGLHPIYVGSIPLFLLMNMLLKQVQIRQHHFSKVLVLIILLVIAVCLYHPCVEEFMFLFFTLSVLFILIPKIILRKQLSKHTYRILMISLIVILIVFFAHAFFSYMHACLIKSRLTVHGLIRGLYYRAGKFEKITFIELNYDPIRYYSRIFRMILGVFNGIVIVVVSFLLNLHSLFSRRIYTKNYRNGSINNRIIYIFIINWIISSLIASLIVVTEFFERYLLLVLPVILYAYLSFSRKIQIIKGSSNVQWIYKIIICIIVALIAFLAIFGTINYDLTRTSDVMTSIFVKKYISESIDKVVTGYWFIFFYYEPFKNNDKLNPVFDTITYCQINRILQHIETSKNLVVLFSFHKRVCGSKLHENIVHSILTEYAIIYITRYTIVGYHG